MQQPQEQPSQLGGENLLCKKECKSCCTTNTCPKYAESDVPKPAITAGAAPNSRSNERVTTFYNSNAPIQISGMLTPQMNAITCPHCGQSISRNDLEPNPNNIGAASITGCAASSAPPNLYENQRELTAPTKQCCQSSVCTGNKQRFPVPVTPPSTQNDECMYQPQAPMTSPNYNGAAMQQPQGYQNMMLPQSSSCYPTREQPTIMEQPPQYYQMGVDAIRPPEGACNTSQNIPPRTFNSLAVTNNMMQTPTSALVKNFNALAVCSCGAQHCQAQPNMQNPSCYTGQYSMADSDYAPRAGSSRQRKPYGRESERSMCREQERDRSKKHGKQCNFKDTRSTTVIYKQAEFSNKASTVDIYYDCMSRCVVPKESDDLAEGLKNAISSAQYFHESLKKLTKTSQRLLDNFECAMERNKKNNAAIENSDNEEQTIKLIVPLQFINRELKPKKKCKNKSGIEPIRTATVTAPDEGPWKSY